MAVTLVNKSVIDSAVTLRRRSPLQCYRLPFNDIAPLLFLNPLRWLTVGVPIELVNSEIGATTSKILIFLCKPP